MNDPHWLQRCKTCGRPLVKEWNSNRRHCLTRCSQPDEELIPERGLLHPNSRLHRTHPGRVNTGFHNTKRQNGGWHSA